MGKAGKLITFDFYFDFEKAGKLILFDFVWFWKIGEQNYDLLPPPPARNFFPNQTTKFEALSNASRFFTLSSSYSVWYGHFSKIQLDATVEEVMISRENYTSGKLI